MKKHENVLVFSGGATIHQSQSKRRMPYYPQGLTPNHRDRIVNFDQRKQIVGYRPSRQKPHLREFTGYPSSVLEFRVDELGLHPVAKPVGLLEFLIETSGPERSCLILRWGPAPPVSPPRTPGVGLLASKRTPSSFGSR
jgi:site-specific DNA-methyltransferase (adenine-specific)